MQNRAKQLSTTAIIGILMLVIFFLGYAAGRAYKTYEINMEKRIVLQNTNQNSNSNNITNSADPSAGQKELVDPNRYAPKFIKLETTKDLTGYNLINTANFVFSNNTTAEPVIQNAGYANIFVNGNFIDKTFTNTFSIPNSILQNGTNTISVTLNANNGKTWWSKKGTLEARANIEVNFVK